MKSPILIHILVCSILSLRFVFIRALPTESTLSTIETNLTDILTQGLLDSETESQKSGNKEMIKSINEFRTLAGLPKQKWNTKLANNAAKTGQACGGKQLVHQLGPGSYGQVLTFGYDDADKCEKNTGTLTPFEVYYLAWLCEVPGDKGLQGKCPQIVKMAGINVAGQRGHHDILAGKNQLTIGCAFTRKANAKKCEQFPGVWACDLA
jgi:hypothetical protein